MKARVERRSVRVATICAIAALAACRDNAEGDAAAQLLDEVQQMQYRTWTRAPGYTTRMPSTSPHGDEVDIFVNEAVASALGSPNALTAWPVGSVIVKDGYASTGELEVTAILSKEDDGWFWASTTRPARPSTRGRPPFARVAMRRATTSCARSRSPRAR